MPASNWPAYRAYLLRLWKENRDSPWRASLEDAHTGARHAFADPEKLLAFLKEGPPGPMEEPDRE